jgi:hypothetical protein
LSGCVRQQLLNQAIASSDAARVVSFFRSFLREAGAAGQAPSASQGPSRKPTYTRAQVQQIYDQHRRGAYRGLEAEWVRQDADIIAASREGRIQNPVDK